VSEPQNELLMLTIEGRDAAKSGRARRIRHAAGLSRADIAQELGVTPAAVGHWELGRRVPRRDLAAGYARLLRELAEAVTR
jgi:putative molybdopterin biosynthesis protein